MVVLHGHRELDRGHLVLHFCLLFLNPFIQCVSILGKRTNMIFELK